MSDTGDNLQQTGVLVHEIGQLRYGVFVGLTVIVVLAMAIVALWLLLRHREKVKEQEAAEAQERAKDERAARHADALGNLAGTIREHIVSNSESMIHFGAGVSNIEEVMRAMHRQIEHVLEKQDGKLTQDQSLATIESFFFSVITEKTFGLVSLSLLQNNYEQRKAFVQERIKTDAARVLTDVRAALKALPLTVRPEAFFLRADGEGERFLLCDLIWSAVEPLYLTHNTPVGDRIAELRYKLLNAVKDYFEHCRDTASLSGTRPIMNPRIIKPTDSYKKTPSSASIRPL